MEPSVVDSSRFESNRVMERSGSGVESSRVESTVDSSRL